MRKGNPKIYTFLSHIKTAIGYLGKILKEVWETGQIETQTYILVFLSES
jgi:hypothetical protein